MFSAYHYLPLHPPQEFMEYQKSEQFTAAAFAFVVLYLKKQLSYLAVFRQDMRWFCSKAWMEIEKSSEEFFNRFWLLKVQLHQCRNTDELAAAECVTETGCYWQF